MSASMQLCIHVKHPSLIQAFMVFNVIYHVMIIANHNHVNGVKNIVQGWANVLIVKRIKTFVIYYIG